MKSYQVIDELLLVNELAWSLYNSNPSHAKKINMATDEVKRLIENLSKHDVKYILVGGFAMAFHGHVRATDDIDLWIKNTPGNMDRLKQSLIDSGITEASALRSTTQLVAGFTMFNLHETDFKVDLLHNLKAFREVDFDTCFGRTKLADYYGMTIPVLGAADLLKEKEQLGRDKDSADIIFLKRLINL